MVKEANVEASSGSPAEGTLCVGLLYFSSSFYKKGSKNRHPLCVGLSHRVNVVHKEDNSKKEVAKQGQALRDFKYACMGRSLYRNHQPVDGSIRLPSCEGLVMLAQVPVPEGKDAARQEQVNQNNQQNNEGGRVMPRPPTQIRPHLRPQNSARGLTPEEFGTRFIRSAGIVAKALKQNVYRVGNNIKTMVEDIFHSGGSGSK